MICKDFGIALDENYYYIPIANAFVSCTNLIMRPPENSEPKLEERILFVTPVAIFSEHHRMKHFVADHQFIIIAFLYLL